MITEYLRPTHAEINLDNIEHNLRQIRKIVDPDVKICAVVKADGYGHGAFEVAQVALSCGASYLAVAILDEAMELREKGIRAPILILGFTPEDQFDKIIEHDITQTVFNLGSAIILSQRALKHKKKAKVHIKIDTGMSRIGFKTEGASLIEIKKLFSLPGLCVEGIFTHFARADEREKSFTKEQLDSFISICDSLERAGFYIPLRHTANSAALIKYPETHFNMVRPGIIIYGLYPSHEVSREKIFLKPAMSVKTKISHVKVLSKGTAISYGGTYVTQKRSIIATLPVGYADGYSRLFSSKAEVLVKAQRAPIVGRICMDQCMIDVTDIEDSVNVGQDVVLFGRDKVSEILADELAEISGTINYEVICAISRRVPRIYIRYGKILEV